MKTALLLITSALLIAAITSCETVGYKANCFGPPSPAQVDAGNQIALKMTRSAP